LIFGRYPWYPFDGKIKAEVLEKTLNEDKDNVLDAEEEIS
jgi:hypothetical protein